MSDNKKFNKFFESDPMKDIKPEFLDKEQFKRCLEVAYNQCASDSLDDIAKGMNLAPSDEFEKGYR